MPVSLTIDDGPQSAPWVSPAITPGSLNGNGFTPAGGNALRAGVDYDFRITVRNTGNEATEPPAGAGPTGPFRTADSMIAGGVSPTGTSSARIDNSPGFPSVVLKDASGTTLYSLPIGQPLNTAQPRAHVYGYSPSGRIFILVTDEPGGWMVRAIAAETLGNARAVYQPGQLIVAKQIAVSGTIGVWASTGIGFVPTRDVLFLTWTTSTAQVAIDLLDLEPGADPNGGRTWIGNPPQAGQIRFSPAGDVMAIIGQPGGLNNLILLYETPALDGPLPWVRRGLPIASLTVNLPVTLTSVKPRGYEAIRISSGSATALIDSPTPALPAVAVHLWVGTSGTVFDSRSARQYPQATSGSVLPPSGFIDRLGANEVKSVFIDANWKASLPPPGEHFCAIAEAFTTPGTTPPDPRQRASVTLSLLERQIAQRNLVVM